MSGKTFFILFAIAFDIVFAPTLMREIGRQFSRYVRSLPCFSIKVIIAFFWELDISPYVKASLTHSKKELLIKSQHIL